MIRQIRIENFKSIEQLTLRIGRVTVLIGENGSGKSNLLEAIAFASAAASEKLDHEFLATRGIRLTEPRFMRAAFSDTGAQDVLLGLSWDVGDSGQEEVEYRLRVETVAGFSRWTVRLGEESLEKMERLKLEVSSLLVVDESPEIHIHRTTALRLLGLDHPPTLMRFVVFSPEYAALRTFETEGQILPLGIRGEGLFSHLKALASSAKHADLLEHIAERLELIGWFERFELPRDLASGERVLRIRDRFLAEGAMFDQRSANEGFLFLLLYFTLMLSPATPPFFAIDNVDASLNPKLCGALMKELVTLAKEQDKQVLVTTHNPAVLDGLDLHDDDQQLWVLERNKEGRTRAQRVAPPRPLEGQAPMKLSEAFLRGYIGGLPKGF